jgi:hypothetical protein
VCGQGSFLSYLDEQMPKCVHMPILALKLRDVNTIDDAFYTLN